MDRLLLYPRHRMGSDNVAIMDVLRYIIGNHQQQRPVLMGFIADQVPFWNNIGDWLTFLDVLIAEDERRLVNARALIGANKFLHLIFVVGENFNAN